VSVLVLIEIVVVFFLRLEFYKIVAKNTQLLKVV
jgi:hypothetical protein